MSLAAFRILLITLLCIPKTLLTAQLTDAQRAHIAQKEYTIKLGESTFETSSKMLGIISKLTSMPHIAQKGVQACTALSSLHSASNLMQLSKKQLGAVGICQWMPYVSFASSILGVIDLFSGNGDDALEEFAQELNQALSQLSQQLNQIHQEVREQFVDVHNKLDSQHQDILLSFLQLYEHQEEIQENVQALHRQAHEHSASIHAALSLLHPQSATNHADITLHFGLLRSEELDMFLSNAQNAMDCNHVTPHNAVTMINDFYNRINVVLRSKALTGMRISDMQADTFEEMIPAAFKNINVLRESGDQVTGQTSHAVANPILWYQTVQTLIRLLHHIHGLSFASEEEKQACCARLDEIIAIGESTITMLERISNPAYAKALVDDYVNALGALEFQAQAHLKDATRPLHLAAMRKHFEQRCAQEIAEFAQIPALTFPAGVSPADKTRIEQTYAKRRAQWQEDMRKNHSCSMNTINRADIDPLEGGASFITRLVHPCATLQRMYGITQPFCGDSGAQLYLTSEIEQNQAESYGRGITRHEYDINTSTNQFEVVTYFIPDSTHQPALVRRQSFAWSGYPINDMNIMCFIMGIHPTNTSLQPTFLLGTNPLVEAYVKKPDYYPIEVRCRTYYNPTTTAFFLHPTADKRELSSQDKWVALKLIGEVKRSYKYPVNNALLDGLQASLPTPLSSLIESVDNRYQVLLGHVALAHMSSALLAKSTLINTLSYKNKASICHCLTWLKNCAVDEYPANGLWDTSISRNGATALLPIVAQAPLTTGIWHIALQELQTLRYSVEHAVPVVTPVAAIPQALSVSGNSTVLESKIAQLEQEQQQLKQSFEALRQDVHADVGDLKEAMRTDFDKLTTLLQQMAAQRT